MRYCVNAIIVLKYNFNMVLTKSLSCMTIRENTVLEDFRKHILADRKKLSAMWRENKAADIDFVGMIRSNWI